MPADTINKDSLTRSEKRFFLFKENIQKWMVKWFGLGVGLSVVVEYAHVYNILVTSRRMLPGSPDPSHFDMEIGAILGIAAGLLIGLVPVLIAHNLSVNSPQDFRVERYETRWQLGRLFGFIAIHISAIVLILGAVIAAIAYIVQGRILLGPLFFMSVFGALFLAGPLMAEGIWTLYTAKHGIRNISVLRNGIWRSW